MRDVSVGTVMVGLLAASALGAQEARNLTDHPAADNAVVWSPDSRSLLISSERGGSSEVYLVDLLDPRFGDALFTASVDLYAGSWSLDGRVAMIASTDEGSDVWVADSLGADPMAVHDGPGWDWWPWFAPDGRLYWNSTRYGVEHELVVAEGEEVIRITENPWYDAGTRVSPDGRWILFHSYRNENYDLYLRSVHGGQDRRLTAHIADDSYGTWSPDGGWVVFSSARTGNKELWALSIETGDVLQVTDAPGSVENYPAWSPDGRWIAFVSDRDGNDEIYVMPAPEVLLGS